MNLRKYYVVQYVLGIMEVVGWRGGMMFSLGQA